MVLSPEPETGLDECQTRIVVIPLGETSVEFHVEIPKLFAMPVREVRRLSFALTLGFLVIRKFLDIIRDSAFLAYISVAETYDCLMAAGSDVLQEIIHGAPVKDTFFLAYIAVEHI